MRVCRRKNFISAKACGLLQVWAGKLCAGPEGCCAGFSPAIHILQKIFESDVLSLKI